MFIRFDVYDYEDLSKVYQPWSGATYNYELLCKSNTWEEFLCQLEDLYPQGLTETELNDILWFEDEFIYNFVDDEFLDYEELQIKKGGEF